MVAGFQRSCVIKQIDRALVAIHKSRKLLQTGEKLMKAVLDLAFKKPRAPRGLLIGLLFGSLLFFSNLSRSSAAELIMFEQDYCSWCEAWHEEIGGVYHKTAEGKLAPLRRVDIHNPIPAEYSNIEPTVFTPTFVLWEDGKELARLRGYPGDEFFWYLLGEMLEKLPNSAKQLTK